MASMSAQPLPRRISLAAGAGLALMLLFFLSYDIRTSRSHFALLKSAAGFDILEDVYNSTLGFQKIFIINLPNRVDHRDALSLAARLTGIEVEYVDGVTEVDEKLLPPHSNPEAIGIGSVRAWRAHMNVARRIVEENITSALVLEGDVDWDIRIKAQLHDFARASRQLLQDDRLDQDLEPYNPDSGVTANSPYGDTQLWDLLWIGHCGSAFPGGEGEKVPAGRVVISDDQSVPEPQHLDFEYGSHDLIQDYPPHTRVVSRARGNVCTLAYGMSQAGARRFLYQCGIKRLDAPADLMYRTMCDGSSDRPVHSCLTVQPTLFQHHRPEGKKSIFSGIADLGDEYNEHPYSFNIRWSTRINFEKLVYGQTDYIDSYKDGEGKLR